MTAAPSIEAHYARIRLDRLDRCKEIVPFRPGDEPLVCGNDGFELRQTADGWRHSTDEIKAFRALADPGFPR